MSFLNFYIEKFVSSFAKNTERAEAMTKTTNNNKNAPPQKVPCRIEWKKQSQKFYVHCSSLPFLLITV